MQLREPSSALVEAMDAICQKAKQRGCRLWIDAEQQVLQTAIDSWAITFMRRYNKLDGSALVYNTLQAYLKCSRDKLRAHLAIAADEGWIPAIKLVRGAYITNDKRAGIHDTKQETDDCYDTIVRDILTQSNLGDFREGFPKTELFIAGHNPTSVAKAMDLVAKLSTQNRLRTIPAFGQLQVR
jgi:proline dehydrogenase